MSLLGKMADSNPEQAEQAYTAISDVLCTITPTPPTDPWTPTHTLAIELLPSSIPPAPGHLLLHDGHHVGIPKKTLTLAFLHATHFFSRSAQSLSADTILPCTAILLLHDPEHLTAANWRKRRLLSSHPHTAAAAAAAATAATAATATAVADLHTELNLLDAILTSPLHRQSKSPTLWWHRSWLLAQPAFRAALDAGGGKALKREMAVVLAAAERHRCNYYAWAHARRVVGGAASGDGERVLADVARDVERWCRAHPGDTSGWSFLGWCVRRPGRAVADNDRLVERVLGFAERIGWEREALWRFVEALAAEEEEEEEEEGVLSAEVAEVVRKRVEDVRGRVRWRRRRDG